MSPTNAAAEQGPIGQLLSEEISGGKLEVPILPRVANEVLSSTLDDKADSTSLSALIQQDQAIASHVLRIVNSPAFRGSTEIVALQQAIARLGLDRIRELALTISVGGTLLRPSPYDAIVRKAWRHGLRTGLWAKEVARASRKNVEIAYLSGLLHNVGVPVVINRICQMGAKLTEQKVIELTDIHACAAGTVLADRWHLPAAVGETIRYLGNFSEAQNAQAAVAVIDASTYLATCQAQRCLDVDDAIQQLALQHLNFYPDDLAVLLEHADRIDETVKEMG